MKKDNDYGIFGNKNKIGIEDIRKIQTKERVARSAEIFKWQRDFEREMKNNPKLKEQFLEEINNAQ